MLRKLREARENDEGFTLIELLVVVIIIGILAAIAIPVFLNQRENAYVAAAESDARNAAIQVESYFAENEVYPGDATWNTGTTTVGNVTVTVSDNVTLAFDNLDDGTYMLYACHALVEASCATPSTSATATYNSAAGGLQ